MSKRANQFERIAKDYYRTIDDRAVKYLLPHLKYGTKFCEPCAGDGILTDQLTSTNFLKCTAEYDIEPHNSRIVQKDMFDLTLDDLKGADVIITNPAWSRDLLHPAILHFKDLAPTWLLFDADWMHTKQSMSYMEFCTDIVSIGRLIWMEGTKTSGKDNCCFYRFDKESNGIKFHPKIII